MSTTSLSLLLVSMLGWLDEWGGPAWPTATIKASESCGLHRTESVRGRSTQSDAFDAAAVAAIDESRRVTHFASGSDESFSEKLICVLSGKSICLRMLAEL